MAAIAAEVLRGAIARGNQAEIISPLYIRITENPLTAENVNTFLSAIVGLHTKCWLLSQGRLADLIEYGQTRDLRFVQEADLAISKLSHNSPLEAKIDVGEGLVKAITDAIERMLTIGFTRRQRDLENQARDFENASNRRQAEDAHAATELERKEKELALEIKSLEIERERLRLSIERQQGLLESVKIAIETADTLATQLYPDLSDGEKSMVARSIASNLSQLSEVKGLELIPPLPSNDDILRAVTFDAFQYSAKDSFRLIVGGFLTLLEQSQNRHFSPRAV